MTVFTDPDADAEPDADAIRDAHGDAAPAWDRLLEVVAGAAATWRYRRDGGRLARVMRGSHTVAWVSVEERRIRMSLKVAMKKKSP